jgi:hypothetical protein
MEKETLKQFAEKETEIQGWGEYEGLSEQYAIKQAFINGTKWQSERMYSEKEVKQIIEATLIEYSDFVLADIPHWFEQFKKK